ncbi:MAG: cell division protein FtsX [Janthinobacterium lividum]
MLRYLFKQEFSKPDIPLEHAKSSKLIPWMMALMVYLATMSLTSTVLIHRFIVNWQKNIDVAAMSHYLKISYSFLGFTIIVTSVIAFTTVMTIIFITRTGLTIHERIIDILRLMGAERKFINKQFQKFFFKMALKGGMIGLIFSGFTYSLIYYKNIFKNFIIFDFSSTQNELWFVVLFTPLLMMVIVLLSAKMTVFMALEDS